MTDGSDQTRGAQPPRLMNAEQFARYIERRLTLYEEEIELIDRVGMQMRLHVRGVSVDASLANFYAAYRGNPAQIDAVVRTFVRVLLGDVPADPARDFAELADQIYPMLKRIELLVKVRERNLPMLVYREFLADLIVTYVIDGERSVAFINDDHLEHWGISAQALHAQAVENLRVRTERQTTYITTGEGAQQLFIFNSGDGYDATRLLLTSVLATWADAVPGHLVIGIPNRDFLIAFSDADGDILRNVAHQIQVDAAQRAYGLTDQLFTLENGRIREYEWE